MGVPRSTWMAVGAAAGAAAGAAGATAMATVGTGAALLAVALAFRAARRWADPTPLIAAGLGLLAVALRVLGAPPAGAPPPLPGPGDGPWTAVVESVGAPRNGDQVAWLRLVGADGSVVVVASLPGYPELSAGTLVEVEGRLRPPPDDDGYGAYLVRTGASGTLDAKRVRIVRPASAASLQAFRDGAGDALQRALPEPEAGLAAGILIGLRERVDRDLAAAFATAGASHIVAISGWNIAIVAGIVGAMLRGRPRRLVAIVVGGTIAAYVVAAGGSPSVVRAAVMAAVVLVARETGRAGRAAPALAWAATILLVASPDMISDAGFRLSVAATAGLLAWGTSLGGWLGRRGGGRLPGWLAESLGISLAAQVATLPDVLATFARLSLVAPAVNLLVVPLVPIGMAGGLLALAGGALGTAGAPAWIATLAGLPGWLVLHVMVAIVRIGAGLPLAAVALPETLAAPAGVTAAMAIGAGIAWQRRHRTRPSSEPVRERPAASGGASSGRRGIRVPRLGRTARFVLAAGVITSLIGVTVVADAAGRATRLMVLDVGQGDAILLQARDGGRMLVDGGPDPARLLVELDQRIPPWDRRIDIVVLTHPHEDHVAGLVRVLDRYSVGRVYEPGMRGPGPGWEAWDAALRAGPPRGTLAAGQRIILGEIRLDVLWPDPGTVPVEPGSTGREINDTSIVLLGDANGRRFLLTGDAEDDVDPQLVARGLPRLDVLKVAHHGSATATSQPLLDAVRPAVAVISVGAHNDYGHPAPATLARLEASGARVYRTDRDGSVTIDLTTAGVVVHASGGRTAMLPTTGGPVAGTRPAALPTRYDRVHDDPRPARGWPPAGVAGSARLVPAARVRGGRRRRLACPADRRPRSPDFAVHRRRGGPAPRHRQAAGSGGARPPPSRRRVRGLARGTWAGRACARGPRSPGDPARGARSTRPGHGRPRWRPGSSPTRTSGPASSWSRWRRGSPRGAGGTHRDRRPGCRAPGARHGRRTMAASRRGPQRSSERARVTRPGCVRRDRASAAALVATARCGWRA